MMAKHNRHVALETCFNFRDLGGYQTASGQSIRWGCVFRSDSLRALTSADFAVLQGLRVRTVIDATCACLMMRISVIPYTQFGVFEREVSEAA